LAIRTDNLVIDPYGPVVIRHQIRARTHAGLIDFEITQQQCRRTWSQENKLRVDGDTIREPVERARDRRHELILRNPPEPHGLTQPSSRRIAGAAPDPAARTWATHISTRRWASRTSTRGPGGRTVYERAGPPRRRGCRRRRSVPGRYESQLGYQPRMLQHRLL